MNRTLNTLLQNLYFHTSFYYWGAGIVFIFVLSFFVPFLFIPAQFSLYMLAGLTLWDIYLLFRLETGLKAERILPEKLSNGDVNDIYIELSHNYGFKISANVTDEIPPEFQYRDLNIQTTLERHSTRRVRYVLVPRFRGKVGFGYIIVTIQSPLSLAGRRFVTGFPQETSVYPSFKKMHQFHLKGLNSRLSAFGLRKTLRRGHSMEFDNIKEYVSGDDFRTVNWKATAKTGQMMVNQYQEEISQTIYSVLDKGRVMKMPFHGLSLLDYAINAILMISYVVVQKNDYAGFFSFSKKPEDIVLPGKRSLQMQKIMNALYNVRTDFFESNYSALYQWISRHVHHRSMFILFTNFETQDALQRQLPYLKLITQKHLLLIIFFENTELKDWIQKPAENTKTVFDKIAAEKFLYEQKLIVRTLTQNGIHTILTRPENTTIDTINKYLEIKKLGLF